MNVIELKEQTTKRLLGRLLQSPEKWALLAKPQQSMTACGVIDKEDRCLIIDVEVTNRFTFVKVITTIGKIGWLDFTHDKHGQSYMLSDSRIIL